MIDQFDFLTPYPIRELRALKKSVEAARANMPGIESVPKPSVNFFNESDMPDPRALPQSTTPVPRVGALPQMPNLAGTVAPPGSALPRSQAAASTGLGPGASGVPTQARVAANVPGQAPAAAESVNSDPFEARRTALQAQLTKLEDTPPDYSAAQAYARQRGEEGRGQLGAAILAGVGPSFTQRLQPTFAAQYSASQKPLTMEGAIVTPDGQVVQDPQFKRVQLIQNLSRRIADLDQLEQRTLDRASREEIAREKLQNQLMLRQMINAAKGGGSGGGSANEFGGPAQIVAKDAQGRDIWRHTKSSRQFQYDDSGQAVPFGGGTQYEKRDLPQAALTPINAAGAQYGQFESLVGSYHQGFNRMFPGTGGIQNWVGRNFSDIFPDAASRANWYSNYKDMANKMRNELFGSALTAPELKSFNEANITEEMDAATVYTRLNQQRAAAAQAVEKLRREYGRNYVTHQVLPKSTNIEAPAPGTVIQAPPAPKRGTSSASVLPNAKGAAFEQRYGGGF